MRFSIPRMSRAVAVLSALLLLGPVPLAVGAAPAAAAPPSGGMTGAALTTVFNNYGNTSGRWTGADSTASVLLPDGRIAWLFSDTLMGTVEDDFSRPRNSPFINNSIMIQDGGALTATVTGGTTAAPAALLPPAADGQFYWVADGVVEGSALKVLYNRYRKTGSGGLDVALTGTVLATIALPALTVTSVVDLGLGTGVSWGSAMFNDGGYTYIYGSDYVQSDAMRFAHLARVPAGGLGGAWQYWNGTTWSGALADAARLPLSGVGGAFGVQKVGSQYVLVTVESNVIFGSQVVAYTASSPAGPFAGPIDLFTAPEPAATGGVIVYDARVHPELAPSGRLLVSYNVNDLSGESLYADARVYRPRFVDVAWPRPVPDPSAVPAAPSGLTATTNPSGSVALSWSAPSGTGLTYTVYQRDVTAGQTHFARVSRPTTTSATSGLLKTGHTYEYRVTAVNAAGEGPPSGVRSVGVVIAAPPAPTGLTATAAADGTVVLSWSSVPYAWKYTVKQRDVTAGDTDFISVNDPAPGDTTTTAGTLSNNHVYEFYVIATHGGGDSPASAKAQATARYPAPAAPTGLTAVAQSDGTIKLTWSSTATNVYFWIYQKDVTAGDTEFTKLAYPTTCCTFSPGYLTNGHVYEYQVASTNLGGDSPLSTTARATSTYPPPAAPTGLTAAAGAGQVTLTWTAGASGVWYWIYQRDVTDGETEFTQLVYPVADCCTVTPGGLTNGHVYEFKVTSIGAGGESGPSNLVRATPEMPLPPQVTGLTATPAADGRIALKWNSAGSVYYWIAMRDVTTGQTLTRLSLPTLDTAWTASLLTSNHVYEFTVTAENSAGDGPSSAAVRGTSHIDPPDAPPNLTATAAGDGTIDLDWDAPAPGLYYWIWTRDVTAGQTAFTKAGYPTDKTSISLGPYINGHTYEFKVAGENGGGVGAFSGTARATSAGGQPKAPSGLTATAGDGEVTLKWTASPTASVYYWLESRPAGGTWKRSLYPIGTCCTFTVSLLTNGTSYEFRLRATNSYGDSPATNTAAAKPLPPSPAAPTGLTATAGNGQVTLRWTASSTPSVYYWLEIQTSGGAWKRQQYPIGTCCTFTASYLANGTTYGFRLRSTNLAGDSSPSNAVSARPMPPVPAAPTGLTASAVGDTGAKLTWKASSTPSVYYWLYYKLHSSSGWTRAAYPISTCCSFTLTGLQLGKTYDFMLRATNLAGDSGNSNTASATLTILTPPVPTGVKAVPVMSNSNVTISWKANSLATAYVIYARQCGYAHWSMIGIESAGSTSYTHFFATHCYEYRVVSDRWSVTSAPSATAKAYGMVDDYYLFPAWTDGWVLDSYGFKKKQCTSFVALRVWEYYAAGSHPTFRGPFYFDARFWAQATSEFGGTVTHTPFVGAVAEWTTGSYGHVAWVAGIDGDQVILEEYNFNNAEAYGRRKIPASAVENYLIVK